MAALFFQNLIDDERIRPSGPDILSDYDGDSQLTELASTKLFHKLYWSTILSSFSDTMARSVAFCPAPISARRKDWYSHTRRTAFSPQSLCRFAFLRNSVALLQTVATPSAWQPTVFVRSDCLMTRAKSIQFQPLENGLMILSRSSIT